MVTRWTLALAILITICSRTAWTIWIDPSTCTKCQWLSATIRAISSLHPTLETSRKAVSMARFWHRRRTTTRWITCSATRAKQAHSTCKWKAEAAPTRWARISLVDCSSEGSIPIIQICRPLMRNLNQTPIICSYLMHQEPAAIIFQLQNKHGTKIHWTTH